MKRTFLISGMMAVMAAVSSCEKPEPVAPQEPMIPEEPVYQLYFSTEAATDPSTRTQVDEKTLKVTWEDSDQISALIQEGTTVSHHLFKRNPAEADAFYCEDFKPVEGNTYTMSFLYPAVENWTKLDAEGFADAALQLAQAELQQAIHNDAGHLRPAFCGQVTVEGRSQSKVTLQHLNTMIRVKVKNGKTDPMTIKSVVLESQSAVLGGQGFVNPATASVRMDEPSALHKLQVKVLTQVQVKPASGEPADIHEFYFAAPAFTAKDLKITVLSDKDPVVIEKSFEGGKTFAAGHLYNTTVERKKIENPEPPKPEKVYTPIKDLIANYPKPDVAHEPQNTKVEIKEDLWLKGVVVSNMVAEGNDESYNRYCYPHRFYLQDSENPNSGICIELRLKQGMGTHGLKFGDLVEINLKGMTCSWDSFRSRMIRPANGTAPTVDAVHKLSAVADPQRVMELKHTFASRVDFYASCMQYQSMYVEVSRTMLAIAKFNKSVKEVLSPKFPGANPDWNNATPINNGFYSFLEFLDGNEKDTRSFNLLLYRQSPLFLRQTGNVQENAIKGICVRVVTRKPASATTKNNNPVDYQHDCLFVQRTEDCGQLFK